MLTKTRNAVTTSVIAFLPVLSCRKGTLEKFAVDEVEH